MIHIAQLRKELNKHEPVNLKFWKKSGEIVLPGIKQALANFTLEKDHFGKRLLDDVVTIMDNDIENYPSYPNIDLQLIHLYLM